MTVTSEVTCPRHIAAALLFQPTRALVVSPKEMLVGALFPDTAPHRAPKAREESTPCVGQIAPKSHLCRNSMSYVMTVVWKAVLLDPKYRFFFSN